MRLYSSKKGRRKRGNIDSTNIRKRNIRVIQNKQLKMKRKSKRNDEIYDGTIENPRGPEEKREI